jgi:putative toxin-antitoxin system antitoxin component (TIGR02293 family)
LPVAAIRRIIVSQMAQAVARNPKRTHAVRRPVSRRTARSRSGLERFRASLAAGSPGPNGYVLLIGIDPFTSPQVRHSVERGLPYSAFEHLVDNTSLPPDEALALVNIPRRTLTRRKREGRFHQDESDRLVRASRIFGRALTLFEGDRDGAKHWLSAPQKALGGEVPLVLARTEVGAIDVERLIGRLEHGVFT